MTLLTGEVRPCRRFGRARRSSATNGSALLVVLTVLALMTTLLIANGRVVWHLNRELRVVEKRQIQHWAIAAGQKPPPARPHPHAKP